MAWLIQSDGDLISCSVIPMSRRNRSVIEYRSTLLHLCPRDRRRHAALRAANHARSSMGWFSQYGARGLPNTILDDLTAPDEIKFVDFA
jgi:hypothetical protein